MSTQVQVLEDIARSKIVNSKKAEGSDERIRRVAILYVHGQGEQAPLKDLKDLAQVIWRDSSSEDAKKEKTLHTAPVDEPGQSEQQQILTNRFKMKGPDGNEVSTSVDFHQFYWADLMEGNRLTDFWVWLMALMHKDPKKGDVPKALSFLRTIIMLTGGIIALFGSLFGILSSIRFVVLDGLITWGNFLALIGICLSLGAFLLFWQEKWRYRAFQFGVAAILYSIFVTSILDNAVTNKTQLVECLSHIPRLELTSNDIASDLPAATIEKHVESFWIKANTYIVKAGPPYIESFNGDKESLNSQVRLAHVLNPSVAKREAKRCVTFANKNGLLNEFNWIGTEAYKLLDGVTARSADDKPINWPPVDSPTKNPSTKEAVKLEVSTLFQPLDLRFRTVLKDTAWFLAILVALISFAILQVRRAFLVPVMTDSARLFSSSPRDVKVREAIRKRGLGLLERLHRPKGVNQQCYDEIIVVAHSLGTAVAYGVLNQFWGTRLDIWPTSPELDKALTAAENSAVLLNSTPAKETDQKSKNLVGFRQAQRRAFEALKGSSQGNSTGSQRPWLISKFITLGSPLTYAGFLLCDSREQFQSDIFDFQSRAVCPPAFDKAFDNEAKDSTFCTSSSGKDEPRSGLLPHFSAMASVCSWTNLYFKTKFTFWGDIISGPLNGQPPDGLGLGILDVALNAKETGAGFAHNHYWACPNGYEGQYEKLSYLRALRLAVGLNVASCNADDALLELQKTNKSSG